MSTSTAFALAALLLAGTIIMMPLMTSAGVLFLKIFAILALCEDSKERKQTLISLLLREQRRR